MEAFQKYFQLHGCIGFLCDQIHVYFFVQSLLWYCSQHYFFVNKEKRIIEVYFFFEKWIAEKIRSVDPKPAFNLYLFATM